MSVSLAITAQASALSPSCCFTLSEPLTSSGAPEPESSRRVWTFTRESYTQIQGSLPLTAQADSAALQILGGLFETSLLAQVSFAANTVTLFAAASDLRDWSPHLPPVAALLRTHWRRVSRENLEMLTEVAQARAAQHASNAVFESIQKILTDEVNPGLAAHGGSVEAIELTEGGVLSVKLSGGCQGCVASKVTLKQGIEKALFAKIPSLREVRDVTDHQAGAKPFFR